MIYKVLVFFKNVCKEKFNKSAQLVSWHFLKTDIVYRFYIHIIFLNKKNCKDSAHNLFCS